MAEAEVLEFWPEYQGGPLWAAKGKSVDLSALAIPVELRARGETWSAQYADERLPIDGAGDPEWVSEGVVLLAALRDAWAMATRWWSPSPGGVRSRAHKCRSRAAGLEGGNFE